LARKLVEMYYNNESALAAESEFDKLFIKKEVPEDIPEMLIENNITELNILDILIKINFAPSRGEARRLVTQGGVSVNGERINDISQNIVLTENTIIKVGKRKFIKLKRR